MADFEELGIKFVTKGKRRFLRAMGQYNDAVDDATDETREFEDAVDDADDKVDELKRSVRGLTAGVTGLNKSTVRFSKRGLANMILNMSQARLITIGLTVAATAATAAIVAAGGGALYLAGRAAKSEDALRQFRDTAAVAGRDTQAFFEDLRASAKNTVSDIQLLESANKALADTTEETAEAFGQRLPQLLNVARQQALRTGRDVQTVFDELVKGIKQTDPELIANSNIVVDTTEAYQRYARRIDISTNALNRQQKRQALLNATIRRGRNRIEETGEAQLTVAQRLQRSEGLLRNIANTIGQLFQPALNELLADFNNTLAGILQTLREQGTRIASTAGTIFKTVRDLFQGIINIGLQFARPILNIFLDPLRQFVSFITGDGKRTIGEAAAALIETIGNAYLRAANQVVFPVVLRIARFVRDALTGFSPAKIGALKNIDTGARALMKTWAKAIGDVSLEPVTKVAAEVDKKLGEVGKLSLKRVEQRLLQLDKALLPFQNRVRILEARFNRFKKPAQNALDIINDQVTQLQQAVVTGDKAAAERLRTLREQRAAIKERLDANKTELQQAKLQLQLKKAQQAQERSLLQARQRQLELQQRGQEEAEKAADEQEQRRRATDASAAGGGSGVAAGVPVGANVPSPETAAGLEGISFFQGEVDTGESLFAQAELDQGALKRFRENQSELQSISQDVQQADILGGLSERIESGLQKNLVTPAQQKINRFVGFFTDPEQPGSIPNRLQNLDILGGLRNIAIGGSLQKNLLIPARKKIDRFVGFFTDPEQRGSIPNRLQNIRWFGNISAESISTAFNSKIIDPISRKISDVAAFFTQRGKEGSLPTLLSDFNLRDTLDWAIAVGRAMDDEIITPIRDHIAEAASYFTQRGKDGSLPALLDDVNLNAALQTAMNVGQAIENNFILPIREGFQRVAGLFLNPTIKGSLPSLLQGFDFSNVVDLSPNIRDGLLNPIRKAIQDVKVFFTDPGKEGSLPSILTKLNLRDRIGSLPFAKFFRKELTLPVAQAVDAAMAYITNPDLPGSIRNMVKRIRNSPFEMLGRMSAAITRWVNQNLWNPLRDFINWMSTPDKGFLKAWGDMPNDILNAVGDLNTFIQTVIFNPIKNWVKGAGKQKGLPGIINAIVDEFGRLPRAIFNALSGIGDVLWAVLTEPVEAAANAAIDGLQRFVDRVVQGVNGLGRAAGIGNVVAPQDFGEFSLPQKPPGLNPTFPGGNKKQDAPGARRGGLFTAGRAIVGEAGREMIASAQPFAVMSNRFVRAMDAISNSILGSGGAAQAISSSSVVNTDNSQVDRSITYNNFAGQSGGIGVAQQLAELRAFYDI